MDKISIHSFFTIRFNHWFCFSHFEICSKCFSEIHFFGSAIIIFICCNINKFYKFSVQFWYFDKRTICILIISSE